MTRVAKSKSVARSVPFVTANISITPNNVIANLADPNGNVLVQSSSGSLGFRGAKKLTPYVASLVVQEILKKASKFSVKTIGIVIKGINLSVRDSALKAFLGEHGKNYIVVFIRDETPIPHNGCRPGKRRKV